MENHSEGLVTCVEEDRISNLPKHLIESILEGLPVPDVVKTSILSKKWRYRWTKMRALVFDKQFFRKYAKYGAFGGNGFTRIINKVLILHKGPISKFLLHIPPKYEFDDSFEEVDQWMMLLSRNGVRELILTDSNQRYELPSYVFSCLELTKLKLRNCFFKPPLKVEGFLNLNDLELWNIDFRANLCGTQINLPQLKKLSMSWCTNVYNFNINATKLQALIVIRCPDAMLLRLLQSPYLTLICVSFQKPIEDNVQVEKMTLPIMLSNLRKIVVLYLDGFFFKALIAEKIPKWLPHPVNSLKRLFFVDVKLDDLDQLHGALCLLRNSPKLESLYVMSFNMNPQAIYYDVEPASNHLESPNCLDCRLHRLQTVKIECLEGSKPELLFIKLLLAHSPSLQKFTITTSRALNAKKIIDICKDVMRFPRASRKVEVIYSS